VILKQPLQQHFSATRNDADILVLRHYHEYRKFRSRYFVLKLQRER